MMLTAKKEMDS